MTTKSQAREIGYACHGGMSSPLYAFASTGKVQSERHRADTLAEVNRCQTWLAGYLASHPGRRTGFNSDAPRLAKLAAYLQAAPVEPVR